MAQRKNTGNSIPSNALADLNDNTIILDEFVNSKDEKTTDRLGGQFRTIAGMQKDFNKTLSKLGFIPVSAFEQGATLTLSNEVLLFEQDNQYYRWTGDLPKVVDANSTPDTAGGIGGGKWVLVGDIAFLSRLKQETGTDLVGSKDGTLTKTLEILEAKSDDIIIETKIALENTLNETGILTSQAAVYRDEARTFSEISKINANIYKTIEDGLEDTSVGDYFTVPDDTQFFYLTLYYHNEDNTAVVISNFPGVGFIDDVAKRQSNVEMFLAQSKLAFYKGSSSDFLPIVVDESKKAILYFDKDNEELKGLGIKSYDDIVSISDAVTSHYIDELNIAGFVGKGNKIPIIVDSNNRAILYYDVNEQKLVGVGLNSKVNRTAPIPLPDSLTPVTNDVNIMLGYGQSLSVGAVGQPVLSTSQPYSNLTFSSGTRANGNDYSSAKLLVEDALQAPDGGTNRGETFCSGAANHAVTLAAKENGMVPSEHVIFASTAGKGGTAIANLIKGSAWYDSVLLGHINGAYALHNQSSVHAVMWAQGETDIDTSPTTRYDIYKQQLEQLQIDIENDIKSLNGQVSPVFVISYQTSYRIKRSTNIAFAQLDLCKSNEKFYLSTPCYHLPFASDGTHLTNVGYKLLGAYFGRAYKTLVLDKSEPQFINPISATASDKTLTIRFDVPVEPLVIDTLNLANTNDFGFVVKDDDGTIQLSNISTNQNSVTIELSRVISNNAVVRYALDDLGAGLNIIDGASGNLRDSENDAITINNKTYQLFNVCPHFELKIIKLGE